MLRTLEERKTVEEGQELEAWAKLCPLLSLQGFKKCVGEKCALFQERLGECSLKALTRLLVVEAFGK
jgi:hypothetical protein